MSYMMTLSDVVLLIISTTILCGLGIYISMKYIQLVGFIKYARLEKQFQEYKKINKGL